MTCDAGFAGLQWTLNGYTLTLASFILLGGSLGDRFGRRRIFMVGVGCGSRWPRRCARVAPTIEHLIAARVLQGIGGALLTPGSLAMISASFARERPGQGDRCLVGVRRHRQRRSGRSSAAGSSPVPAGAGSS